MLTELPGRDAGEWEWLLFEQSGVVTSAQACRLLGRGVVRSRIMQHRWRRICRNLLLTENGRLRREQQLWVAVLAAGRGARLAGTTAATESGVCGLRPEPLHVIVPAQRGTSTLVGCLPPDMPRVSIHRTAILPPAHRQVGRPPRTTAARAVVDAAAWARTDSEARTVIAAACQQRRVAPAELRDVLQVLIRVPRRDLISTTLADVEGGAEALSELDFLGLCRRYRLPEPELQRRRTDADGRNRYLDAYWRASRLLVEIDGAHHMDVRHWSADMLRQNAIWTRGDRILRFPAWLVRTRPSDVATQILTALSDPPTP
ncbi:MAG TPA: DUF559 domain-containing protein [Actinoplanes sp.]|nr:DUF559 domain-containing protein [Actinoplanes sp.]